jgi:hypothetical protein
MNTSGNPTKALEVKNMPGKGNNKKGLGPKETPEQMLERLEKKLQDKGLPAAAKVIIQQQIDDLKGVERKASPEEERNAAMALAAEAAAAAQAAAGGGGGDDARREDILAAQAYVTELKRQAKEAEAPVLAEMLAAGEAAEAENKARKGPSTARISFRAIPGEGVGVSLSRADRRDMEAQTALKQVRILWSERVAKANADLDAVRAGRPYAAVLEERAAEERQSEQPAKTPEEVAAEKLAYRKAMAEFAAERDRDASDLKAATVWQAATRLGPRPNVLDYDSKLLAAYRAAMAAAAAAPSGSSAE